MACRSVLWMTTLAYDRSFMFTSLVKRHGSRSRMTSRNSQTVPNDARGPLRVKRYTFDAHREPLNVRFAPKATELLCGREMTPWAMCGRLRVGKSFLDVCSIGRCSHVFGLNVSRRH